MIRIPEQNDIRKHKNYLNMIILHRGWRLANSRTTLSQSYTCIEWSCTGNGGLMPFHAISDHLSLLKHACHTLILGDKHG